MMKRYAKPLMMVVFLLMLGIVLIFAKRQERDSVLGCPVINEDEAIGLVDGKQSMETPSDLLYYQEQRLPFLKDYNAFLIPTESSVWNIAGALGCMDYGQIYLVPTDAQALADIAKADFPVFSVYVVNDASYYEVFIGYASAAILTFQTEAFENENAYGSMNLYTPVDREIGMYSFKTSDAKLSYEITDGLTQRTERNYRLELTKGGMPNKLNLADLRKDDDWELDSLFGSADQILQFFAEWNDYCARLGEERFALHYRVVDFYLDGRHMGNYLLRVPMDGKQLTFVAGSFLMEAEPREALYMQEIEDLRNQTVKDSSLYLEYYFWEEEKDDLAIVYAIPRRFTKIGRLQ